jgi:hypothetical protein
MNDDTMMDYTIFSCFVGRLTSIDRFTQEHLLSRPRFRQNATSVEWSRGDSHPRALGLFAKINDVESMYRVTRLRRES